MNEALKCHVCGEPRQRGVNPFLCRCKERRQAAEANRAYIRRAFDIAVGHEEAWRHWRGN